MGRRQFSVIIVDSSPIRIDRMAGSLASDTRFKLLGKFRNLNDAYNITEKEQPDFVVISMDLAMTQEYPMYAAMLDILDVKRIVVVNEPGRNQVQVASAQLVSSKHIDNVGGLANLIADGTGLTSPENSKQIPVSNTEQNLVVIGASTGGIEALLAVLEAFPQDCPPTLIVQHIRAQFVPSMVQRLDRSSEPKVLMAKDSLPIQPGQVLVAPGNSAHLTVHPQGRRCRLASSEPVSGHRPSVDALFNSVAECGPGVVAVLLTGMGRDGALGLARIRNAGGWTIAQDQASSTVYGMPRAAVELGAVQEQLPLNKIGKAVLAACQHQKGRHRHV